jgi:hypothetical protein
MITLGKNFGEFMGFPPKRFEPILNSNQIPCCFASLIFLFKFYWEFAILLKRKVVLFEFIYQQLKFGKLCRAGGTTFIFCRVRVVEILEKNFRPLN